MNYTIPRELTLGRHDNVHIPYADQQRQRVEVAEVLRRFADRPGIILADEVGMGKTFVALAVGYALASSRPSGPVVVMVPPNLLDKWKKDLERFCKLYLDKVLPLEPQEEAPNSWDGTVLRFGCAETASQFFKYLDDPPRRRCRFIFLNARAMTRGLDDKFVKLALIRRALLSAGKRRRIASVRRTIHRFLGDILVLKGHQNRSHKGEELWQELLGAPPQNWQAIYNSFVKREADRMTDDPVPRAVLKALEQVRVSRLADALEKVPVKARGGTDRLQERLTDVRRTLNEELRELWREITATARWRSPLLIFDEAHHLKNPDTCLARQFRQHEEEEKVKPGDGTMAHRYERMLFLTATPFQLAHHELVEVLRRFTHVHTERGSTERSVWQDELTRLERALNEAQRNKIRFYRLWSTMRTEDLGTAQDVEQWWAQQQALPREQRAARADEICSVINQCAEQGKEAERLLRLWLIRHNKQETWPGTDVARRRRFAGQAMLLPAASGGLQVPASQMLPFFLAARSTADPSAELLSEALCSSYEAFRKTRADNRAHKDECMDVACPARPDAPWVLGEFDRVIARREGALHPKMAATVQRAADLWEQGEKVLIFAFYRHTCRALRIHLSAELDRRQKAGAQQRLAQSGMTAAVDTLIDKVWNRYFDSSKAPGRRALDSALREILAEYDGFLTMDEREAVEDIMRSFLRARTTLIRVFPFEQLEARTPAATVAAMLDARDGSGISWRDKFRQFLAFLREEPSLRDDAIKAAERTQTGKIRVGDLSDAKDDDALTTLPNLQVATGDTPREARTRLMQAFNSPFFPDILIASQVMSEGVDLQRFCRHVIHHDLDWNPSDIEQRTGRIDRIGCKAEGRDSIMVYLPYVAGTADERQYKVMSEREHWFQMIMGQNCVEELVTRENDDRLPPPAAMIRALRFDLGLTNSGSLHE